ncbi:MAG: DegV family protein, partial [Lachnospiraceae bacterium]|nr:DegV family protein [Lachnospiraceae bacterium]
MNVRIISDSTADVSRETREKITVIPLSLFFGEEEYIDTVTITYREFYEKLIESDELPRTSQANPESFREVFEDVAKNDETAVLITLSSTFSGTYQSALIAAEDYEDRIFVVDSKNATIGSGILVELAVKLSEEGLSAKEIYERLLEEREKICLMGIVDTLEYLKKGGRISKTAAFAGEMLGIKPVLRIKDGEIIILGKARGSKKSNNLLVQEIEKTGGV